eukprot:XP_012815721.1 PREDICTED: sialic acid-binding Ig-like lectin 14 [Xenopus tropicalis]
MNLLLMLFLLWTCQGGIHSQGKEPHCSIQIESVRVRVGDSVTIPCWFSYPRNQWDSSVSLRVYWRAARNRPCGSNPFIYNHTEKWVHGNYTGRISLEGNPKEQNVVSLRIQGIRRSDGPMFCCRLEPEGKTLKPWQNIQGTFIHFSGEFSVEQVDAVPAIEGETAIIPCIVHSAPGEIQEVTWRWGDSYTCANNPIITTWSESNKSERHGEFSLVDFPTDVSLRIEGVTFSHRKHYCCLVRVEEKTAQRVHGTELGVAGRVHGTELGVAGRVHGTELGVAGSVHGTELGVAGRVHGTELGVAASKPSVGFSVSQSLELTAQSGGSASISCTFSYPPHRAPLWVGVYWRVGNLTGPFAYHPSQEMVLPMYKGRTELRGEADLYIRNVQEADNNTSYYCFVILRFCKDSNSFTTETHYGTGTSLHVTESEKGWVVPVILTLIALLVLLLVGTLTYLRMKGNYE